QAKLGYDSIIKTQKQCGGDIVSGRNVPPEMLGEILTCRFKNQSIVRYQLTENGSGFGATLAEPLIHAKHPNFRPVDCKMGPDGGIYVCDWYNLIINHARLDFRDKRRDVDHGRIWRITYKDRPLVKRPKLEGIPLPDLLDHLKAPEYWTRHQTKLVLSGMDPDRVAGALKTWSRALSPDESDVDHHRVEALWAYQHVNRSDPDLLKEALRARTPEARAAAARVIRYWWPDMKDPLELLAEATQDESSRVRLEAVLSAGFIPRPEALPAALRVVDQPMDRFLEHALRLTIDGLKKHWEPALEAGALTFHKPEHAARISGQRSMAQDMALSRKMK
ncbi:MAG: HEAT repeat domain-containing protein, partial [Verrucomicrobiota bacterium]